MIVRPVPLGAALAVPNMSHYREKLLEHVFISEVLQECFLVRGKHVEVLHAEVDVGGYDLVFQVGAIIRHVQLKTRFRTAVGRKVKVNANLEEHRGGCVVWMFWDVDPATNRVQLAYRWFGNPPRSRTTKPLPTHNNNTGPHRQMLWGDFEPRIQTMGIAQLVKRLFG